MNTAAIVWPPIRDTYGENGTARALAADLAVRIDKWPDRKPDDLGDRERMILHVCWDWFSGGRSRAEVAARRIEQALSNATTVPGPPSPPLVPGHLGAPSYEECAAMVFLIGVYDVLKTPMPAHIAWRVRPWESRLREWVKREVDRGNMDKLIGRGAAIALDEKE